MFLLDHRDCDRSLIFALKSLCVPWVVVLCVGSWVLAVGRGCVVKLIGASLCIVLGFCLPPPRFCRFGRVLMELLGSCCRGVGWIVLISFTLADQSLSSQNGRPHFESQYAGLRHLVRRWVVGVVSCGLTGS